MEKAVVYALLILFLGISIGYSINGITSPDESPDGLQIPSLTSSIGSVDANNTERQLFSYEFELYNSGNEGVHITSVEPVLSENFLKIALTDENMVIVNKTIDSRSSILVSDQIEFNATGISKTEILKLEPFINGIRISSTETLSFP